MNTYDLTKDEFINLEKMNLTQETPHTEGDIIILPNDTVFKRLYVTGGQYFSNKLYTINSLISNKDKINIPELVFPESLISIEGRIEGFTMSYIKGSNLKEVLNNPNIDIEKKIDLLKQIGNILFKMHEYRRSNPNFFINDLHESNLIVDEQGIVHVVDLDSCSIDGNYPFGTKYVSLLTPLVNYPNKYNREMLISCGGEFIPDENTDLYCYAIMLLNFLYNGRVQRFEEEEYFNYLNYLLNIGANNNLIEDLAKVYSNEANVNFKDNVDSIIDIYKEANGDNYLKRAKK